MEWWIVKLQMTQELAGMRVRCTVAARNRYEAVSRAEAMAADRFGDVGSILISAAPTEPPVLEPVPGLDDLADAEAFA